MKLTRKTDPVTIYNPLSQDFTTKKNFDGKDHTYTIYAMESETFPEFVADHIKKQLATQVLYARGVKVNQEHDIKEILKEISG